MANDVQVTFGADYSGVVKAAKESEAAIDGLGKTQELTRRQTNLLAKDIRALAGGVSPLLNLSVEALRLQAAFGELGLTGSIKAVGGALIGLVTNPLSLAVMGFGIASSAASSLFAAIASSSSAAEAALKRSAELGQEIDRAFTDAGKAATRLHLISTQALELAQKTEADRLTVLIKGALRGADSDLNSMAARYFGGPLGKMLDAFVSQIRTGTADVGKFNEAMSDLMARAADLDLRPEEVRSAWQEIENAISPALKLNDALGLANARLAELRGEATADQRALLNLKDATDDLTKSLDKMLATRAAQARAAMGVKDFDAAGPFDQKAADHAISATKAAADKAADLARQVATAAALATAKATAEMTRGWEQLFGTIMSGFDRAATGLLTHTTTWKQATLEVLGSIWQEFALTIEKMVVKWGAMEALKITASIAGAGQLLAVQKAAAAAGKAVQIEAALKAIAIDVQKTFSGVFGFLSPLMGPLAAVPAAAAAGTVALAEGAVASLDVGAWNVPRDMRADIHKGEMVVPANFAEGMRQNGGPTGGGIDERDLDRLVKKLVPHLQATAAAARSSANNQRAMQRNIDSRLRTLRGSAT